jgi:hypothetical protein
LSRGRGFVHWNAGHYKNQHVKIASTFAHHTHGGGHDKNKKNQYQ